MKDRLSLGLLFLMFFAAGYGVVALTSPPVEPESRDEIERAIIAREVSSSEAWRREGVNAFPQPLADDAIYFGPVNSHLEADPKENAPTTFEQYAERYTLVDWQMNDPRVQIDGDTAVLAYNVNATFELGGRPVQYAGRVSQVYVKQGGEWRVVRGDQSFNPGSPQ